MDTADLLVTSTNFTFHGLNGNLEFGVGLRGDQARPSQSILMGFTHSGMFQEVGD